uniref:Ion transport domain-containing protein n=1 Tax=Meloidogyne javanica TaxID=6303 RepID=A0A915LC83_MELJA
MARKSFDYYQSGSSNYGPPFIGSNNNNVGGPPRKMSLIVMQQQRKKSLCIIPKPWGDSSDYYSTTSQKVRPDDRRRSGLGTIKECSNIGIGLTQTQLMTPNLANKRDSMAMIADLLAATSLGPARKLPQSTLLEHPTAKRILKLACLISLINVCFHTPRTIQLIPNLNLALIIGDAFVVGVFTLEAFTRSAILGLIQRPDSYLRDRWCQFDFLLLLFHWASWILHLYQIGVKHIFPSFGFVYYDWLGIIRCVRPMIILRLIRLMITVKVPRQRIQQLLKRSSTQVQNVTVFFLFFMALYAIMGIQLFGRMDYHCVLPGTDPKNVTINDLAIPDTMCSKDGGGGYECPENMECMKLDLSAKSEGFYGMFDHFGASVFTVYLAASEEGWVYVLYDCLDSLPSHFAFVYFVTLIFFLAWLVKNVFIAVITETFAEIRILRSTAFQCIIVTLVLANAGINASFVYKHDESDAKRREIYYWIEVAFTILFDNEFFRLLRLIKASPMLEDFVYKIFSPGKKLGGLVLFTFTFAIWASAVSLQLFCTVPNLTHFQTFPQAFMAMFQIITQEGWTEFVVEVLRMIDDRMVPFVAIYFVAYHLFVTLIVLSLFVAVILDNLEMDEELKKVKQLKAKEAFVWSEKGEQSKLAISTAKLLTHLENKAQTRMLSKFAAKNRSSSKKPQDSCLYKRYVGHCSMRSLLKNLVKDASKEGQSQMGGMGLGPSGTKARGNNRIEEEMRENHPYFDRPLFIIARDSKLRRYCHRIVHARWGGDGSIGLGDTMNGGARTANAGGGTKRNNQIHELLGLMPYLDWTMIPDYLFVLAMTLELIAKMIADGLFFTPNALINDFGGVMTVFIYLTSLTFLILMPKHVEINSLEQFLMICRAMRPLRIYTLVPHIRRVVLELFRGFKEILLVTILMIVVMFIFASFGVQTVGGKLAACNDLTIKHRNECHGVFWQKVFVTRLEIYGKNNDTMHPKVLVPRVWTNPRNFNFDHIGAAMLALFETLSYKGWNVIRDILWARQGPWAVVFIHIYVFIGFDQRRWHDLKARLKMAQPLHIPPKPSESAIFRRSIYELTMSRFFNQLFAALVVLNSATLIFPWNVEEEEMKNEVLFIVTVISAALNLLFAVEVLLKMFAFTVTGFWQSRRNRLDLLITGMGLFWISTHFFVALPASAVGGESRLKRFTYTFGYIVVILRFFTIAGRNNTLKMLMLTVVMSMFRSFFIIMAMVLLVLFYAYTGVILFGMVKYGQAVSKHVNFRSGSEALVVLFRSVTGEDWNDIMHDTSRSAPFCYWLPGANYWETDCGNYFGAIIYFCSFYLIITYIVRNLLVAIIMENFSLFYSSEEDALLSYADIRNFQMVWNAVDVEQKVQIPVRRVKFLLRLLKGRLEVDPNKDRLLFKHMCYEMEKLHNGDDVSFQDVLYMLSYRSVDIRKSLQLEELLQREELEYIIEEEVAKQTIKTWLEFCLRQMPFDSATLAAAHSKVAIERHQRQSLGSPRISPSKQSKIVDDKEFVGENVDGKEVFLEEENIGELNNNNYQPQRKSSLSDILEGASRRFAKRPSGSKKSVVALPFERLYADQSSPPPFSFSSSFNQQQRTRAQTQRTLQLSAHELLPDLEESQSEENQLTVGSGSSIIVNKRVKSIEHSPPRRKISSLLRLGSSAPTSATSHTSLPQQQPLSRKTSTATSEINSGQKQHKHSANSPIYVLEESTIKTEEQEFLPPLSSEEVNSNKTQILIDEVNNWWGEDEDGNNLKENIINEEEEEDGGGEYEYS